MKKLHFSIAIVVMATVFTLFSCGGKEKKTEVANDLIEVTPEDTKVFGNVGSDFSIENKTYKIKSNGVYGFEFSFNITRNKVSEGVNTDQISSESDEGTKPKVGKFIVELLDEAGDLIAEENMVGADLEKVLNAQEGEKVAIKLLTYTDKDKIAKVKKFRVSLSAQKAKANEETVSDNSEKSDDEMLDNLDDINKAVETTGKTLKAAGEAIDALNKLNGKE